MLSKELTDCMFGYVKTSVLCSCQSLGIFSLLLRKPNGLDAVAIGVELGLLVDRLERLLDMSVLVGLLRKVETKYVISPDCVPFLDKSSDLYQGAFIEYIESSSYVKLSNLGKRLIENNDERDGVGEKKSVFTKLYSSKSTIEGFADAMWNLGVKASTELVNKLDLSKYKSLVDVGGGNGSFAIPLAKQYTNIGVTIFDLKQVRDSAERKINQFKLGDRVFFKEGDFWCEELPAADLYVFGFILSDWSDDDGLLLLSKAKESINEGGLMIIVERLFDDEKSNGPLETSAQDLAMMVEINGRHRSEAEYRDMLISAGAGSTFIIKSSYSKHLIGGVF